VPATLVHDQLSHVFSSSLSAAHRARGSRFLAAKRTTSVASLVRLKQTSGLAMSERIRNFVVPVAPDSGVHLPAMVCPRDLL